MGKAGRELSALNIRYPIHKSRTKYEYDAKHANTWAYRELGSKYFNANIHVQFSLVFSRYVWQWK